MKHRIICLLGAPIVFVAGACEHRANDAALDGSTGENRAQDAAPVLVSAEQLAKAMFPQSLSQIRVEYRVGCEVFMTNAPDGSVPLREPGLKCSVASGDGVSTPKGARIVSCVRGTAKSAMHFLCPPEYVGVRNFEVGRFVVESQSGKVPPHEFVGICEYDVPPEAGAK